MTSDKDPPKSKDDLTDKKGSCTAETPKKVDPAAAKSEKIDSQKAASTTVAPPAAKSDSAKVSTTTDDSCKQYYPFKDSKTITPVKTPSFSPVEAQKKDEPKKVPSSLMGKIKSGSSMMKNINILDTLKSKMKPFAQDINMNNLKKIDYKKFIQYGICKAQVWVRDIRNPKKMADKGSGAPSRPMKYPYTFSAKFAQFPLGHYVKNQWIWKYYVVAFAACIPVFYSINKLSNSPGNVAKWAEIRRKEAAEHHH